MASKKGTTRKSSSKKVTKKKTDKLKKTQKKSVPVKRGKNGGTREGAGRPKGSKNESTLVIDDLRNRIVNFGADEMEVELVTKVKGVKKVMVVKMSRQLAIMNMLATEAVENKNIQAAKEFNDRVLGRPQQSVELSGEVKTDDQYTPDDPALKVAAKAYAQAVKQMVINGDDE